MNTKSLFIILLIAAFLSACAQTTPGGVTPPAANPTAAPTSTTAVIVPTEAPTVAPTEAPTVAVLTETPTEAVPTEAPTEAASVTISLVVKTSDHRLVLVNVAVPLQSAYDPAFTGLNPQGGVINGTPYVYDFTTFPTVMAVTKDGPVQQDFIQNPTYGLAVWNGAEPRLAWGTQLIVPTTPSSLQISAPDGSQLETLFQQGVTVPAVQDVAQRWSADGKSLYFSREPVGIGGYIVFSGASSLYKIDIASKQETELIPTSLPSGPAACLDAISLDYRYVADHCAQNAITVRDLTSGTTTTIQPPEGFTGFKTLGSARFSPDGTRLAYALAKNNPDDEQGWVAVSDGLQGSSSLILTGDAGVSYQVVGWLNNQTILVQSSPVPGSENSEYQLWALSIDGTNLNKVADGSFVTAIDNR